MTRKATRADIVARIIRDALLMHDRVNQPAANVILGECATVGDRLVREAGLWPDPKIAISNEDRAALLETIARGA